MSEWIEWEGSNRMPEGLKAGDWVEVRFRDMLNQVALADQLAWKHSEVESIGDIMAYRKVPAPSGGVDMVNKPPHYQLLPGVEVYDVRMAILENIDTKFTYGTLDDWSRSWEYLTRMWQKNGLEDAKKARWYLDKLIEKMEGVE